MTDAIQIISGSGTLPRTRKQSDTPHPHYFNSFQNYCCGPKSKTVSSPTNKDVLPIPEIFKVRADEILHLINSFLIERIPTLIQYTSILPHEFFDQDRMFDNQKYLIDRTMFKTMTEAYVINWVSSLKKLYPVRTSGNGNCLLHAVLIAMVGVHDFNLHLRDRLRQFMDRYKEKLKQIWKNERLKTDKSYGIQSEESNLDNVKVFLLNLFIFLLIYLFQEWEELCDLVRYENSEDGQTASNLQFLEGVHIFSISNMLGRPIIILSEDVVRNKHGEAISYNDLFGIYLPILRKPNECIQIPIILAYDQSHFCPLQTNDFNSGTTGDNYLPLYQSMEHTRHQKLLPIKFLGTDIATIEQTNRLFNDYLRTKKLIFYPDANSPGLPITCVELGNKHLGDKDDFFLLYYKYLKDFFEIQKKKLQEEDDEKQKREQEYSNYNQSIHDNNQRILIKTDPLSSSSPPPSYSSVMIRTNDNKNSLISERRPSYDEAVSNGTSYNLSNDNNRIITKPQLVQKLQTNTPIVQRTNYTNDNQYSNGKQAISNWDPIINESIPNEKIITNINSRGTDSKLKQGKL